MLEITKYEGRPGNLLLQEIGLSFLSKKIDLFIPSYQHERDFEILGLNLYEKGSKIYTEMRDFDDLELFVNNLLNLLQKCRIYKNNFLV